MKSSESFVIVVMDSPSCNNFFSFVKTILGYCHVCQMIFCIDCESAPNLLLEHGHSRVQLL